jgi:hypothetical protein
VLSVCCVIVVPLPPGENPFAVNNNNNEKTMIKNNAYYNKGILSGDSETACKTS